MLLRTSTDKSLQTERMSANCRSERCSRAANPLLVAPKHKDGIGHEAQVATPCASGLKLGVVKVCVSRSVAGGGDRLRSMQQAGECNFGAGLVVGNRALSGYYQGNTVG